MTKIATFLLLIIAMAGCTESDPHRELHAKCPTQTYSRYTAQDYLDAAKTVSWQPRADGRSKGLFSEFERSFLSFVNSDIAVLVNQLNKDGCYYCELEPESQHKKYNAIYNPVPDSVWNNLCPLLYNLMRLDNIQER